MFCLERLTILSSLSIAKMYALKKKKKTIKGKNEVL